MSSDLMAEFWLFYRDIDEEWILDVFDLALGFYTGRYPDRSLHLALNFANKARDRAERESAREAA